MSQQLAEKDGHGLERDNPCFVPQPWDNGKFHIQSWLERSAWRNLKDSEYGCKTDVPPPHPALREDPLLLQIYKIDIATFLTAERVSMKGISSLVSCAPDESSQVFLATQALDEARHYEVFCRRLADFGVTPEQRERLMQQVTTPAMKRFYDLIAEQVDKRNFVSAIVAHNVVLEGMAYPVYRYETKYWSRFDPGLSHIIQGAFADEVHHVSYGEAMIREYIKNDVAVRNRIRELAAQFHLLMSEVFEGVIRHYIGLYQEAANGYTELMGDLEIFPGHHMARLSEEEQVRMLLKEIQSEHTRRLARVGLTD